MVEEKGEVKKVILEKAPGYVAVEPKPEKKRPNTDSGSSVQL